MSAPTAPLSAITAHIAEIQALIASVSAPRAGTSSAAQFAAALSSVAAPGVVGTVPGATAGSASGAAVVQAAEKYLGVPYVWGGESMSGIDCSGLVQAAYQSVGIDLPRVAADQARQGTPVPSLAQAQPGDILTFGDPAYHVAIYLGNNKLIESPEPGKSVHITDVYQTPTSIRRIVPAALESGRSAAQLAAAGISPAVAAYADRFAAAEAQYRLPPGLLAAVAQQESGGNPNAVSPAGAQGLMQLMPTTAASARVNAFDPAQAIPAAARILADNLSRFGSVPLALAAYNAGAGAVAQYGGIPPYAETQNYVKRIAAMLEVGG